MLIDAHTHLHVYGEALDAALDEIRRDRIFSVAVSLDADSYRRTREIAGRCEHVLATFGIHPWEAHEHVDVLEQYDPLIDASPMLGEIGLDTHWVTEPSRHEAQRTVLRYFLEAARRQNKIVNLHTKGAEAEILDLLDEYGIPRAIVHWYSGPFGVFQEMIARGLYFTFGVELAHSEHIQHLAREVPAAQMLTETDNPGGLEWLTGEYGMPAALHTVIDVLAEVRETTPEQIRSIVSTNFARLIADDPHVVDVYESFFG